MEHLTDSWLSSHEVKTKNKIYSLMDREGSKNQLRHEEPLWIKQWGWGGGADESEIFVQQMLNNTFQQEQQSGLSGTRIGKGCCCSSPKYWNMSRLLHDKTLNSHFWSVSDTYKTLDTSVSIYHLCIYMNVILLKQYFNTKYLCTVHLHLLIILLQNMTFHIKLHLFYLIQTCQWAYTLIRTMWCNCSEPSGQDENESIWKERETAVTILPSDREARWTWH